MLILYFLLPRFIKVFWHMEKGHVKERLGQHNNANMVLVHGERLTKTVINEDAATAEVCKENAQKQKMNKHCREKLEMLRKLKRTKHKQFSQSKRTKRCCRPSMT